MLNAIFKNITLATCLLLGLSSVTQGQSVELIPETISTSKELDLLQSESEEQLSQVTRPRRTRSKSKNKRKTYFGFGLGIFLPEEVFFEDDTLPDDASLDYSNGFSLNLFGGYRFSQYFSGELDLSVALGSLEVNNVPDEDFINDLDLDYSTFGIYFNPRFEIPLAKDRFKLYAAPGIGYSVVSSDNDRDFDGDGEVDSITSDSGFSYQIKAGAAYQISDRIDIFGQAKYNSFFLNDLDNLEGITFELGATF